MARSIATTAVNSSRNRGVLMLALLFGVLSAALMFAFLNSKGDDGKLEEELGAGLGAETVVVVTRDVAAGEKITSDMLTTKTIPGAALLPGFVKDSSDIVGKVATAPMFTGEQVITAKVTSYEGQDTLAFKVPDGMRALALMVPHEAWIAGGLPQPGDRVDILGITTLTKIDPLTGQERPDIYAGVIAEDVEVLAVSQTLVKKVVNLDAKQADDSAGTAADPEATPAADGSAGAGNVTVVQEEGETYHEAISITLALTPELAAKVAIIDAMDDTAGQWRILPRQKGDDAPIDGQVTWTLDEVFDISN